MRIERAKSKKGASALDPCACMRTCPRIHACTSVQRSVHAFAILERDYGVAFISGQAVTATPGLCLRRVASNVAGAYTFRILAIGGIAFNLGSRRSQETTNILFKHLTNTRRPGLVGLASEQASRLDSARLSGAPPKQLCHFGKQQRNRDEKGGKDRPGVGLGRGDACFATIRAPKFAGLHTLGRSSASPASSPYVRSLFLPLLFATFFRLANALSYSILPTRFLSHSFSD